MHRTAWVVQALCLTIVPAMGRAQVLVGPSVHFGAAMYPEPVLGSQLGVHFDRFTRFGKETLPSGEYEYRPYNDIRQTIGLNFLGYGTTRQLPRSPETLYRLILQLGYSHNEPTKWAQNEIHDHKHPPLLHVPDSLKRRGVDAGISADLTRWLSPRGTAFPTFIGTGASLSTVYQEAFVHLGVRPQRWRVRIQANPELEIELPRVAGMLRAGGTLGGDAFPNQAIDRGYLAGQYSITLPGHQIALDLGLPGSVAALVPDYEEVWTRDNGFFRRMSGGREHEYFVSWRFIWVNGLVVAEMWNDSINAKDKGPTGGLRVYVRPQWLPGLSGLP